MAGGSSLRLFILGVSLLSFSFQCFCHCNVNRKGETRSVGIKGMFVFGSSLVDNGNNNFLQNSLARADYLPYGVDFPLGPSGRFTNGKNVLDLLGEQLKIPSFIPVFADPQTKGSKIVHGVNFASGASGILDDTGSLAGRVMSLNEQIRNFEEVTLPELKTQLGLGCSTSFESSIDKYLFVVGTGGNDYSFNYFLANPHNVSLQVFTANLTSSLSTKLKKLHSLGARKFVVMSINPLGCSPMAMNMMKLPTVTRNRCVQGMNRAVHLFNSRFKSMVDAIRAEMPGSALVFVNSYKIIRDIIKSPISKGFKDSSGTCCEVASISEGGNGILCKRGGQVCLNRSSHVFFDGLHPTEAVNVQIATKAFVSTLKTEVYPTNIQQMTQIQI
ncbi:GDSL esterase/lipase At1g71250-like [Rosa rugosa]|uniref:GDSL esterase/lipase At1g71250-like n=1 Tax=Rosa rugosa TaxID=74645 RepID=UPI002B4105C7|nr:GDSL esterase/lipase At1g71250-like [Rosa rugosa]